MFGTSVKPLLVKPFLQSNKANIFNIFKFER